MVIEPSEIANSLSEKYQVLHDAFTALAIDAAHFQSAIEVQDAAGREMFTALTRILAFSDHVHVALNLMGEDVRALEAAHGDPLGVDWNEQLEESFEEWFLSTPVASSKVN
jgi:hypothetical protein